MQQDEQSLIDKIDKYDMKEFLTMETHALVKDTLTQYGDYMTFVTGGESYIEKIKKEHGLDLEIPKNYYVFETISKIESIYLKCFFVFRVDKTTYEKRQIVINPKDMASSLLEIVSLLRFKSQLPIDKNEIYVDYVKFVASKLSPEDKAEYKKLVIKKLANNRKNEIKAMENELKNLESYHQDLEKMFDQIFDQEV